MKVREHAGLLWHLPDVSRHLFKNKRVHTSLKILGHK